MRQAIRQLKQRRTVSRRNAKPRKRQTACPSVNPYQSIATPKQYESKQGATRQPTQHNDRNCPATHPPPRQQQQPPSQHEPHRHSFLLVHCLVKEIHCSWEGRKEGRKGSRLPLAIPALALSLISLPGQNPDLHCTSGALSINQFGAQHYKATACRLLPA